MWAAKPRIRIAVCFMDMFDNIIQCFGSFTDDQMFMCTQCRYEQVQTIKKLANSHTHTQTHTTHIHTHDIYFNYTQCNYKP